MRATYLIQDPYDHDAIRLMQSMAMLFGLRPVCFYTDAKGKYYGQRQFPELKSHAVEAEVDVFDGDFARTTSQVSERFDVRAVIPYRDDLVSDAACLLEHLELDWNSAQTYARFRDKHALKQHISDSDPTVRLPATWLVSTVEDVFALDLPSRFVIKPNDGMGSVDVEFFSPADRDAIERHLTSGEASHWSLEEFIDGVEYRINGQVRHDGTVEVLLIGEYIPHGSGEKFDFPYATEIQVPSGDERFALLRDYAIELLAASGLRGCPFHLEVKVDAQGPAMVDLGARPASEMTGVLMSLLHPERPNFYDVAAHDYLGANTFALGMLDYEHYDAGTFVTVFGVCDEDAVIRDLSGVDDVEAMPEFVYWSERPEVGQSVRVTSDLRGTPYGLMLRHGGDRAESLRLADEVRSRIVWNRTHDPAKRVRGTIAHLLPRLTAKGAWIGNVALGAVSGRRSAAS